MRIYLKPDRLLTCLLLIYRAVIEIWRVTSGFLQDSLAPGTLMPKQSYEIALSRVCAGEEEGSASSACSSCSLTPVLLRMVETGLCELRWRAAGKQLLRWFGFLMGVTSQSLFLLSRRLSSTAQNLCSFVHVYVFYHQNNFT